MDKDKSYPEVAERLRMIRNAKHPDMKIKDYTAMLGVNYTKYLNWESGVARPQADDAIVLCDKLGLTMDFIYRGIEAALPQNTVNALSSSPRDKA